MSFDIIVIEYQLFCCSCCFFNVQIAFIHVKYPILDGVQRQEDKGNWYSIITLRNPSNLTQHKIISKDNKSSYVQFFLRLLRLLFTKLILTCRRSIFFRNSQSRNGQEKQMDRSSSDHLTTRESTKVTIIQK